MDLKEEDNAADVTVLFKVAKEVTVRRMRMVVVRSSVSGVRSFVSVAWAAASPDGLAVTVNVVVSVTISFPVRVGE